MVLHDTDRSRCETRQRVQSVCPPPTKKKTRYKMSVVGEIQSYFELPIPACGTGTELVLSEGENMRWLGCHIARAANGWFQENISSSLIADGGVVSSGSEEGSYLRLIYGCITQL